MRCVVMFALLVVAGCSRGGSGEGVQLGAPPASTGGSTAASSTIVGGGIWSHGMRIGGPAWLPEHDDVPLDQALDEYLVDFQRGFAGWAPEAGGASKFDLTVIFHDYAGQNYWAEATRTAWLAWPRGASGKPVRVNPFPLLHVVWVLDRRRELGAKGQYTTEEADAMNRGASVGVVFQTTEPANYEP